MISIRVWEHWRRELKDSPLATRLARGAFWSLTGTAISRGLGLLSSILVARLLGREIFGELGIVQSTVGMFGTFAGFGMGLTATKYVAEFRTRAPERTGRIIGLSSLVAWCSGAGLALLLVGLAPWLAERTLAAPHLTRSLRISAPLLLLGAVSGAQTGALSGFEAFKRLARINLLGGMAAFPCVLAGAWWLGLDGAILGMVASQAWLCWLTYKGLCEEASQACVPLGYVGVLRERQIVWQFTVPALFSSVLLGPVAWACNTMLVNQPGGYEQMGLFNAANQWFNALLTFLGTLGQAALPVLSERFGAGDAAKSAAVLSFYIKLNLIVVIPAVLAGAVASPYIMSWYGAGFAGAWPTLVVVLATAGVLAAMTPVAEVVAASGRMWLGSLMNLGWAICFIGLAWLLVERGAMGLAAARLSAYLLHALWTCGFVALLLKRAGRQAGMTRPPVCVS
jgi:O-antigen/teichoic acid export membrane protein